MLFNSYEFIGSHLTPESAERWSGDFIAQLAPLLHRCGFGGQKAMKPMRRNPVVCDGPAQRRLPSISVLIRSMTLFTVQ